MFKCEVCGEDASRRTVHFSAETEEDKTALQNMVTYSGFTPFPAQVRNAHVWNGASAMYVIVKGLTHEQAVDLRLWAQDIGEELQHPPVPCIRFYLLL